MFHKLKLYKKKQQQNKKKFQANMFCNSSRPLMSIAHKPIQTHHSTPMLLNTSRSAESLGLINSADSRNHIHASKKRVRFDATSDMDRISERSEASTSQLCASDVSSSAASKDVASARAPTKRPIRRSLSCSDVVNIVITDCDEDEKQRSQTDNYMGGWFNIFFQVR